MNNCDHFIGYTLDTRSEDYKEFYKSSNVEDISAIHRKFDYCPDCGEEIDWDNIGIPEPQELDRGIGLVPSDL